MSKAKIKGVLGMLLTGLALSAPAAVVDCSNTSTAAENGCAVTGFEPSLWILLLLGLGAIALSRLRAR